MGWFSTRRGRLESPRGAVRRERRGTAERRSPFQSARSRLDGPCPGGLKGRGRVAAAVRALSERSEDIPHSVVRQPAEGFRGGRGFVSLEDTRAIHFIRTSVWRALHPLPMESGSV